MRATATLLVGCLAAAALSAALVAPAPAYDAWAWLLWGREIAAGTLHTAEGPAFKPLPVAVCALLSPFGDAGPALWVIVARTGALLAVALAFRIGRRLGGGIPAGLLAAVGVALCGSFLGYAAEGVVTGWLLALGLAGAEAWRAGRPGAALACAFGCCLLHVEAWPFAAALGLLLWRRRPQDRTLLAAAAVAVPVLWIAPEWLGSGDPLRSGARARVPNPGQPALADVPGLASLDESLRLPLWPLWIGVAGLAAVAWRQRRPDPALAGAAGLAAVGVAWIVLVAAMAQLGGFSGEQRYATPGAALISIAGAVGLVAVARTLSRRADAVVGQGATRSSLLAAGTVAAVVALAVAAFARLDGLSGVPAEQAHQWRLATELGDAIAVAGGREEVLRCGVPYVGPLRGPLLAYRLEVAKADVEPDTPPARPGVVFRSVHRIGDARTPAPAPAMRRVAAAGTWEVSRACRVRTP